MAKKTIKKPAPNKSRKAPASKGKRAAAGKKKTPIKKKPTTAHKSKTTGGFPWSIVFAAIITFIIGLILVVVLGDRLKVTVPDQAAKKTTPVEKAVEGKRRVSLYFSSKDGKSIVAERLTIGKGSQKAEATAIITQLLKGPRKGSKLESPVPEGTKLLSIRIRNEKALIDFSKELKANHPGGSSAELQTIYAIVNSVTMNITDIKTVQILIDGKRNETLAGHILIGLPLAPDKKIISK